MAFESINVSSLKNALTQCKNSINHKTSDTLTNNISNMLIWQASSQANLKKALINLTNVNFKNLEDKINNYFNIVSYIERYQNLQQENVSLENQYNTLSNNLYYAQPVVTTNTLEDGTINVEEHYEWVKNKLVEVKMNSVRKQIVDNEIEMDDLESKVSNSI